MASIDLILSRQYSPGQPTHLVFGDDGNTLPPGTSALHAEGKITGMRGSFVLRTGATARTAGQVTGMRGAFKLRWDANVSRGGLRQELQACWQDGQTIAAAASSSWHQADKVSAMSGVTWQSAERVATGNRQHWQTADRLRGGMRGHWQDGQGIRSAAAQHWQEAEKRRSGVDQHWQEGQALRAALDQYWQEAEKRRAGVDPHWQQQGVPVRAGHASSIGVAVAVALAQRHRWQEATRPLPGVSSIAPPVKHVCWSPGLPANLLFDEPWSAALPAHLVFACRGSSVGPEPGATLIVPLKRVYMTVHNLEAVLVPSGERVQLKGITIDANDDGFSWSLSAHGPLHLLDQLAWSGGIPQRVRVTIDGISWVFAIDPPERSRKFGERSVQVKGSSVTAQLSRLPQAIWSNTAQRSAQQLALEALELTGVDLDWQISDWIVPANIWSHQGTPLSAVLRIAEAAGAVVRSHRTDPKLIVAPRYGLMPWEWATATADIRMPGQIILTDTLEPVIGNAYNAVDVVGEAGGVHADVVRRGTAGDVRVARVTDALITDIDVGRMRGRSVIGDAAIRFRQPATVPLLSELGLVSQGLLIEVNEPGDTWRGVVRSISVSEAAPALRQAIVVERFV